MGKPSKSLKKFSRNHLKRTVDQRRLEQKYKQKIKLSKRKSLHSTYVNGSDNEDETPKTNPNEVFEDGSAEKFFNSEIDAVAQLKKKNKRKSEEQIIEDQEDEDLDVVSYLNGNEQIEDDTHKVAKKLTKSKVEEETEYIDLNEITIKKITEWKTSLNGKTSSKLVKQVVSTFKAAVKDQEAVKSDVLPKLISLNVEVLPKVFQKYIALTSTSKNAPKSVSTDSKQYQEYSGSLKQYASSLAILVSTCQDASTVEAVFTATHKLIPYLSEFKKPLKSIIEIASKHWSGNDKDFSNIAFVFLRSIGRDHPHLFDIVLKSSYSALLKKSLESNPQTIALINKLKTSAIELYSTRPSQSYDLAFQYVCQLGVHLKNSSSSKSPDAYKTVYNWQYVHSLDFWAKTVAKECDITAESLSGKKSPLRELIYPLVQVILGTIRLIPTPQYFPLRFYLIRSLLEISHSADVYIPVLPSLMEVLQASLIAKLTKPADLEEIDFESTIRVSKVYLTTKEYQDGVCGEFVDIVAEFFSQNAKSIAFPELSIPVVLAFKRFISRSKNGKFNKQLEKLVERLEENSKYIQQKRNALNFGPTTRAEVDVFLKDLPVEKTPFGNYAVILRQIRTQKLSKKSSHDVEMVDA
jgi:nucleolar complex protein 2